MLWTILSASVVLIAAFLVAVTEMLGERADFQRHRESIAIALGVAGVLLLAFGKWRAVRRKQAAGDQPPPEGAAPNVSKLAFLRSPLYWGPMTLVVAGLIFLASPPNLSAVSFLKLSNLKLPAVQSLASGKNTAEVVSETNTAPAVVVVFPPMKMQGVTVSSRRSSAIINAKIYFIGDQVGEAVVTAIDERSVTLALGGQTKVLTLRN